MLVKRFILALLVGCLVLPIAIVIVLGVARLLLGMGDEIGGGALERLALAGGILWAILLVCLLLAQGFQALQTRDDESRESRD